MGWEALVVLKVVHEAQGGIEALDVVARLSHERHGEDRNPGS